MTDQQILESWQQNAEPWIVAIEEQQIESRRLVTDNAIIETIQSLSVNTVLDLGCGEGWLVRKLLSLGFLTSGIDAVEPLLKRAREQNIGEFKHIDYMSMSKDTIPEKYDALVCNFSLIGRESVDHVFEVAPSILTHSGYLIVQTLHPASSCGNQPYSDGWREGSWEGFSDQFSNPAPWYFRTVDSWMALFKSNGFGVEDCIEPVHPKTGNKASLIMVGRNDGDQNRQPL